MSMLCLIRCVQFVKTCVKSQEHVNVIEIVDKVYEHFEKLDLDGTDI